jgi:hypothetical protein
MGDFQCWLLVQRVAKGGVALLFPLKILPTIQVISHNQGGGRKWKKCMPCWKWACMAPGTEWDFPFPSPAGQSPLGICIPQRPGSILAESLFVPMPGPLFPGLTLEGHLCSFQKSALSSWAVKKEFYSDCLSWLAGAQESLWCDKSGFPSPGQPDGGNSNRSTAVCDHKTSLLEAVIWPGIQSPPSNGPHLFPGDLSCSEWCTRPGVSSRHLAPLSAITAGVLGENADPRAPDVAQVPVPLQSLLSHSAGLVGGSSQ